MEYVNDTMTHVYIETDVFQTWQFDFIYKRSFIEREHVNDDTVGINTVPENLETGEYITNSLDVYTGLENYGFMVQTSEEWIRDSDNQRMLSTDYGGIIYNGKAYYCPSVYLLEQCLRNLAQDPRNRYSI